MIISINKILLNKQIWRSIFCFSFLFFYFNNNLLFSQNEYSLIRYPFVGTLQTKNHQEIFTKDSTSKIDYNRLIYNNETHTSQNIFICDNNGDIILQFYKNTIKDKSDNLLLNGDILVNNNMKLKKKKNTCIFLKNNYKQNSYYFIYNNLENKLVYLIINKIGNSFVVNNEIYYFNVNFTECFSITQHYNKNDYWLIIKSNDDLIYTVLIDSNEVFKVNNKVKLNTKHLKSYYYDHNDFGLVYDNYYLNISPDSKYIIYNTDIFFFAPDLNNFFKKPIFIISKFDNVNGIISNTLEINLKIYDNETTWNSLSEFHYNRNVFSFSFLNNFIYLNGPRVIFQFELNCYYKDYIENSIQKVYINQVIEPIVFNHNYSHIYGSNHKQYFNIYKITKEIIDINVLYPHYLSSLYLSHPVKSHTFSNLKPLLNFDTEILLNNINNVAHSVYTEWDLDNNVVNSTFYQVRTDGVQDKCEGDDFYLDAEVLYGLPDTNYRWTGPNGFTSNIKNPFKNSITKKDEGVYTCEVFDKKNTTLYKGYIDLVVNFKPVFKIVPSNIKLLCSNDKVRLNSDQSFKRYLWSNGDTTRFTWINKAGTYSLTAFNSENECSECSTTQTITIENATPPEFDVLKIGEECGSSAVKLRCDRDFPTTFTYLWNTGATTAEISATINGVYTLTVTDTNGCKTSKSVTVTFGQKPIASISVTGPTTFCEGGKVELRASGGVNSNDLFFKWSSGETVPNITVTKSGVYRLVIKHKFSNCVDSAEIEIKVNANLECNIVQNNMLCKGREITLTAEPQGIEYTYLWSTGATTSSIIISQGGRYSVEISLDEFCKSSSVIDVIEFIPEEFEIIATGKLCVGEIVTLSPNKDFASYEWSTGENTKEIAVTNSGLYSVTAIDLNGCVSVNNIEIIFVSPREYNLDFTDYDFGDVEIGAEKRVKFNIPGEVEIQIKGDFAYDMNTNEMVFKPTDEKSYSGEIVIDFGGDCDTTATILFVGRGVNSLRYKAKVIAPTIDTEAGLEDVELPFTFNISRDDLMYPFLLIYKMTFEINIDVYLPNFTTTIINNKRVVELTGTTNIIKGENIIATILGKTFLSEFIDNPINIIDFEHNIPKTDVEQIDGNIKIVGVCTQNLRIIQFRHLTKLNITPNPATDNILVSVSTAEKGTHRLFLTSITGSKKELLTFIVGDNIFEKTFDINFRDFSDGTYILELQTPNQSLTEKVLIIR